jgi:hypothetical protein
MKKINYKEAFEASIQANALYGAALSALKIIKEPNRQSEVDHRAEVSTRFIKKAIYHFLTSGKKNIAKSFTKYFAKLYENEKDPTTRGDMARGARALAIAYDALSGAKTYQTINRIFGENPLQTRKVQEALLKESESVHFLISRDRVVESFVSSKNSQSFF